MLKKLRFKMLRLGALKERGHCDVGDLCQNAAYLREIELRFRLHGAGVAIWEVEYS